MPLRWTLTGAGESRLVRWRIEPEDSGGVRLEIIGEHTPSWSFATLEEARAYADRIEDSAPVHKDPTACPGWWPCVTIDGPETRPVDPQPRVPPRPIESCPHCGSNAAPVLMKPLKYTLDWWDDPGSYWDCPDCDRYRATALELARGDVPR